MKGLMTLGLLIIFLIAPVYGSSQRVEESARDFVLLLHQGEFHKAVELFDSTMKKAVPPTKLRAIWNGQQHAVGTFRGIIGTRSTVLGDYRVAIVTCQFQKRQFDVNVSYDKTGKISGLFFAPVQTVGYLTPEYVNQDAFKEMDVQVGSGDRPLPGTLTVPTSKGPFPAVILVHGSGAHDKDETIGPNKPFRDLAWGLASKGIAVLRYEKRTRHYPNNTANLTVQEETITDALKAVSLLKRSKVVETDRIFVLGHSLGGMLIPRIGKHESAITGFVIMAGNARPLEDLILEQTLYQASLATDLTPEAKRHIEEVKRQVATIKNLSNMSSSKSKIFNVPPCYWLDLKDFRPTETAMAMQQPMLIMQGEKDCQVSSEKDFKEWRRVLSGKKNVQFKLYPALNHLFMKVNGKSTGAEYQQPSNVAATVVRDIADWIMKNEG